MKSSLKLFFSLFLAAGSFTAFAASYTDGIEYFKAGQPDRAKILLERTLDDAGTNKAESYYYLGEIAFVNKDYTAAAEYYKKGLEADPLFAYNLVGQGKLALNGSADKEQAEKVAEKKRLKEKIRRMPVLIWQLPKHIMRLGLRVMRSI